MRRVEERMAMLVTVDVPGEDDPRAVEKVFQDFAHLDDLFSPFKPDSQVSRINRGELDPRDAGALMDEVILLCHHYEEITKGYFTAWFGDTFDPCGLVKSWAIDRSCTILDKLGYPAFVLEAGGDVFAKGSDPVSGPWRIGVRHPIEKDKVARVVLAENLAVATSGTYEKGNHIVNPHTGRPATELICFTVIGPDVITADVYATACFAMGLQEGLRFIEAQPRYEAYAVEPTMVGSWSSGFPSDGS
ncbi:MAG TPA: FAD:protein FMN transferase [Candidatus Dormibacteraeota bacterium]|jgi:thiamine biosynthesis lipoprotein|nr:FAD:protein FMN transferase [Candidatus Dormibacteraeota bacterium]